MYHQQTTIFIFYEKKKKPPSPLSPFQPSLFTLPFLISPSRGPSEQQQQPQQQPPSMTKKISHSQQQPQQQKKKQEANPQKQPSQAASTRANFARDCFYYYQYYYYYYCYCYYCYYTKSKVSAVDIEGGCEPQSTYTCFGQTWNDVDPEGGRSEFPMWGELLELRRDG